MPKKYVRIRSSLPKRIAGVKIPKAIRHAADTPLGAAIIAEALVEFSREIVVSPPMRAAVADLRRNMSRAAAGLAGSLQHAAYAVADGASDRPDEGPPRKRRRRYEADADEMH